MWGVGTQAHLSCRHLLGDRSQASSSSHGVALTCHILLAPCAHPSLSALGKKPGSCLALLDSHPPALTAMGSHIWGHPCALGTAGAPNGTEGTRSVWQSRVCPRRAARSPLVPVPAAVGDACAVAKEHV